jgi:hypothetical protein
MDFSSALVLLKHGHKLRRKGQSSYIALVSYLTNNAEGNPRDIAQMDANGCLDNFWHPRREDILANDWEVVA